VPRSDLSNIFEGIEIGQQFPDIPLWHPLNDSSTTLSELIDEETIVVLITTGCETCVENIAELWDVWRDVGEMAVSLLLIADRVENALSVRDSLSVRDISFRLWCDATRSLREDYRVITQTAYFKLHHDLTLLEMKGWVAHPETIRTFLTLSYETGQTGSCGGSS
jgi:hypothetical protein